jgi:hypothetical protein
MRSVRAVVAPASELAFAIRRAYGFDKRADELIGAIDVGETVPIEEDTGPVDAESAPMIRLVDEVIAEAVSLGASDIHVEPARAGRSSATASTACCRSRPSSRATSWGSSSPA